MANAPQSDDRDRDDPTHPALRHEGDGPRLLTPALLQPGERIQVELKPALAMVLVVCYRTIFWGVMLVVANEYVNPDRYIVGARLAVAIVAVGGTLAWVAVAVLDWFSRVYVLTDRRIIRQRGILNVNVFECELDRIQNTYLDFTWEQRLLGLGTISFLTSGTNQIEAAWAHVGAPMALHRRVAQAVRAARGAT